MVLMKFCMSIFIKVHLHGLASVYILIDNLRNPRPHEAASYHRHPLDGSSEGRLSTEIPPSTRHRCHTDRATVQNTRETHHIEHLGAAAKVTFNLTC